MSLKGKSSGCKKTIAKPSSPIQTPRTKASRLMVVLLLFLLLVVLIVHLVLPPPPPPPLLLLQLLLLLSDPSLLLLARLPSLWHNHKNLKSIVSSVRSSYSDDVLV